MTTPPTSQQLDDIEARANAATKAPWFATKDDTDTPVVFVNRTSPKGVTYSSVLWNADWATEADGEFTAHARTDVDVLLAEVRRLNAALTAIRHLHKDSPMGPCPVCIDADAVAAGSDGLMPYPCPTGRLAGAEDCEPPHMRAAQATDRCGARHHRYPDTVCTEGAGHYRRDRDSHAGPLVIGGQERGAAVWDEPETGSRRCGHDDYHDPREWADRPGVWCPGHNVSAAGSV